MFTGIIEELGTVERLAKTGSVFELTVRAVKVLADTAVGDSIAVNGACLTVVNKGEASLTFEIMPQTVTVTTLGALVRGEKVNLERSLKVGDRLSGHFVLGHIDGTGVIRRKTVRNDTAEFMIAVPAECARFILPKGSIAVDGISLTVASKKADTFTVSIIPHTLKNTTLSLKAASQKVNIECDILAKRSLG